MTVTATIAPHTIAAMRIARHAGRADRGQTPARPVSPLLTRRRTIDYCRVAAAPCGQPGQRPPA